MGLLKIFINGVFIISLLGAIVLTALFIYGAFNPQAQTFNLKDYNPFAGKQPSVNASSELTQFVPNMRFNHDSISYYINPDCSEPKKSRFENALFLISDKTKILTFYPTNEKAADIVVGCSKTSYQQEKNVFIAGEGGPTEYLDSRLYPIIERGKVLLYEESNCDYPVTELHELLHVFGFNHINDSRTVLYPYIDCSQSIPQKAIDELIRLYSIKPLADLYFINASAVKTGMYINFDVNIKNEGLTAAKGVMLEIYAGNEKLNVFNLGDIDFGTGVKYSAENVKLPSMSSNSIKLSIVTVTDEFDKANNVIELGV